MKGWTLDAFDAAPTLRDDLPEPVAGAGEAVINVKATSVNPVDAAILGGFLRGTAEYRFPVLLGRDFAGVAGGSEVFGFVTPVGSGEVQRGAWAQRIAVPADMYLAAKPSSLSMAEAGAAALAGVTALLCVEAVEPREGEGGAAAGQRGLVRRADRPHLAGRGRVRRERRGAEGGRRGVLAAAGIGDRGAYVAATSDPSAVARLGELIDAESITVPICEGFSFGQIPEALSALDEHKQGKLSVV